jgi:hypothetical protein
MILKNRLPAEMLIRIFKAMLIGLALISLFVAWITADSLVAFANSRANIEVVGCDTSDSIRRLAGSEAYKDRVMRITTDIFHKRIELCLLTTAVCMALLILIDLLIFIRRKRRDVHAV